MTSFKMKNYTYILLLLFFASCGMGGNSAYNFETNANYRAVQSELDLFLHATGHVEAGADLSEDGFVTGKLSGPFLVDTIFFVANSNRFLEIYYQDINFVWVENNNLESSLLDFTYLIGYTPYVSEELKELEKVIFTSAYGPKATYMEGQTELIKVGKIDFR